MASSFHFSTTPTWIAKRPSPRIVTPGCLARECPGLEGLGRTSSRARRVPALFSLTNEWKLLRCVSGFRSPRPLYAASERAENLRLNESEPSIGARFEGELGRPVLVVGPFPQPVGHIDMMMTALSERGYAVARVPFLFGGPASLRDEPPPGPGYPTLTYKQRAAGRDGGRRVSVSSALRIPPAGPCCARGLESPRLPCPAHRPAHGECDVRRLASLLLQVSLETPHRNRAVASLASQPNPWRCRSEPH